MRAGCGVAAVALAAGLPAPLRAQSTNVHAVVALASQLVDRGLAITPATPTLQGAVSWTSPTGWSLGVSAGAELRSPGHSADTLAQVSRSKRLSGEWQVQGSLLYGRYSGMAHARTYDRAEAGVNWIYRDVWTFGLAAIRGIGASNHRIHPAADVDFHWPLTRHLSFSAGAGVTQALVAPHHYYSYDARPYGYNYNSDAVTYRYGHLGVTWSHGPWRVELDRIATDLETHRYDGDPGAARWVATISRSF